MDFCDRVLGEPWRYKLCYIAERVWPNWACPCTRQILMVILTMYSGNAKISLIFIWLCNWTFACLGQEFFFSWIQNLRDPPSIKSKHVIRWHVVEADTIKYFSYCFCCCLIWSFQRTLYPERLKKVQCNPKQKLFLTSSSTFLFLSPPAFLSTPCRQSYTFLPNIMKVGTLVKPIFAPLASCGSSQSILWDFFK